MEPSEHEKDKVERLRRAMYSRSLSEKIHDRERRPQGPLVAFGCRSRLFPRRRRIFRLLLSVRRGKLRRIAEQYRHFYIRAAADRGRRTDGIANRRRQQK